MRWEQGADVMQGMRFGDDVVYLYGSWLFTDSPILKELYCESHRWEPWLIRGEPERYGRYVFENALYIPARERRLLLEEIPARLVASPGWSSAVQQRVRLRARELLRLIRRSRRGERAAELLDAMLVAAAQVLSVGVIKEALEPEDARRLLQTFVPTTVLHQNLLALYQPLCLPHYDKVEARVLHFAARHLSARSPRAREKLVRRCIDTAAHHSRFLLEPTELADPEVMRSRFEEIARQHRRRPGAILRARHTLLERNLRARRSSWRAEREILAAFHALGPASLHARRTLMGLLRMIQFVATWEELKHILVMEAAREVRHWLEEGGLPITARTQELRAYLATREYPVGGRLRGSRPG
ncbi:MAG: hypothetical protein AB2A00_29495 [Myxococcota bacterium]